MATLKSSFTNYTIWAITVSIDFFFFWGREGLWVTFSWLFAQLVIFFIIIIHCGLQIIETLASIIFLC